MCGIVGFASINNLDTNDYLLKGVDAIRHRGPDDMGYWISGDGRVGLGHRRLSIIDLSPLGRQPMFNYDKDVCIIFNGEIYNFLELKDELMSLGYQFVSKSDTEVIANAYKQWGKNFLSRLNGMFAIAIYDLKNDIILLARDRAGEKPLFYTIHKHSLFFASELKALLVNPEFDRKINHVALDCYLSMGYVPGELCIIDNFNKLAPACALQFNLRTGTIEKWKYWELPDFNHNKSNEVENTLLDELEFLLEDAVKKQLISDVPIGVLLSGGVDSSLVTAMAARNNGKVKTFTVGFPEYNKYDESSYARLIADYFGTEHTEISASDVSVDLIFDLAKQYDEPIIDSSMIPTFLVSQLIRNHCTVALGGDGGDELFGGYGHYNRLLLLKERIQQIPSPIRAFGSQFAANFIPLGFKGRTWLQSLNEDLVNKLPLIASYFDWKSRKKLLNFTSTPNAENIRNSLIPRSSNLLQRATRMDFLTYLPEDILVKVDRASMLNSLEIRAPFLDYRIIEFAFSKVPSHLKTTISKRKILLKQLSKKLLPPEFDNQRKQGFGVPIGEWFRSGEWNKQVKEVLFDSNPIFNFDFVKRIIANHEKGYNNTERIFGLLLFELWRNEYKCKL